MPAGPLRPDATERHTPVLGRTSAAIPDAPMVRVLLPDVRE